MATARLQASADRLITVVAANDRLLKALITLLALRHPDILEDLLTMFAAEPGSEPDVSAHLSAELRNIAALVGEDALAQIETTFVRPS